MQQFLSKLVAAKGNDMRKGLTESRLLLVASAFVMLMYLSVSRHYHLANSYHDKDTLHSSSPFFSMDSAKLDLSMFPLHLTINQYFSVYRDPSKSDYMAPFAILAADPSPSRAPPQNIFSALAA